MKRVTFAMFVFLVTAVLFSGCSGNQRERGEKISIVATIFPQYDWVRQIIGEENMDRFDLTLLVNSGVDLHSFSPSVSDIAKIKTCDVFIHVGGHSDNWVRNVLRDANADIITMNLLGMLGSGLLIIDDAHVCDECGEVHDPHHHADEHVWVSLKRAKIICAAIAAMLSEADPDNAQAYKNNLEAYTAKLSALDAEYQAAADAANVRTLVFADRFPFRYLTEDYKLDHYAAFHGCSAETEASFATIASLANNLNRLKLNVVMVTESSDQSIARTVINNTTDKNQRILVLDSVQSVTAAGVINGAAYLSIMENNLAVLKEALM